MRAGGYPRFSPKLHDHLLQDRVIRWGNWGDSAALPQTIVNRCNRIANGHLAYSHQIFDRSIVRADRGKRLAQSHMVSAHNWEGAELAHQHGMRFYQTVGLGEKPHHAAIRCPYPKVQCINCGLCNGGSVGRSIYNPVHGAGSRNLEGVQ